MAIATAGIRVVHHGDRNGGEIWNTGYWLQVEPTAGGIISEEQANDIAEAVATDFDGLSWDPLTTGLKAYASPGTRFLGSKVYFYPAGSSTASRVGEFTVLDPATGTSTFPHPYSDAIVASLRSVVPGRTGRGRMYLPCNGIEMTAAGQYISSTVSNVANLLQAHLNSVNGAALPGLNAQIVSVASNAAGVARPVASIVVNSVPDTQRRRDNKLLAATTATRELTP